MSTPLEAYRAAILQISPSLDEEAWAFIEPLLEVREYEKKSFFIKEGDMQPALGFVVSGLLRAFYVDEAGDEITTRFVSEGSYATDYSAFIDRLPSSYAIQCLEPTQMVLLPFTAMQQAYQQFWAWERVGRLVAEQVLKSQHQRIVSFQFLDAEGRYLQFLERHAHLFPRISLTHLASYLGIQRPHLSRIRRKLAES